MDHQSQLGYEKKFADVIQQVNETKAKGVPTLVVAYPWVLGDNYDEIVESLSRLADAGLTLAIAARTPSTSRN